MTTRQVIWCIANRVVFPIMRVGVGNVSLGLPLRRESSWGIEVLLKCRQLCGTWQGHSRWFVNARSLSLAFWKNRGRLLFFATIGRLRHFQRNFDFPHIARFRFQNTVDTNVRWKLKREVYIHFSNFWPISELAERTTRDVILRDMSEYSGLGRERNTSTWYSN